MKILNQKQPKFIMSRDSKRPKNYTLLADSISNDFQLPNNMMHNDNVIFCSYHIIYQTFTKMYQDPNSISDNVCFAQQYIVQNDTLINTKISNVITPNNLSISNKRIRDKNHSIFYIRKGKISKRRKLKNKSRSSS